MLGLLFDQLGLIAPEPIRVKLGLGFDRTGTNNAMTYVLVMRAKVGMNERL